MKKLAIAILLFFLPTKMVRILLLIMRSKNYVIEKKVRVGFSFIWVNNLYLAQGANLGHLNFIKIKKLVVEGGKIGRQNIMKGNFEVLMFRKSWILNGNKFTANPEVYQNVQLTMKPCAAIIANHIFDMTDSISIGEGTVIAGSGSQMWTHSFFVTPKVQTGVRVDSPIIIGNYCYIGSRSIVLAGVIVGDFITIGAGCCVSKNLDQRGCYVGQGLRYLPMDIDDKITSLGSPLLHDFVFRKKV